jgi:hypothetical protein
MAMIAPNQTLTYRPLDKSISEFRLLRLHPTNNFSNSIRCDLEYASLNDPPSYSALSYQWGDPNNKINISVGRKRFAATRNLAAALRNLRSRGCVLVWADAICINQNDHPERGDQVTQMAAIYTCAAHVDAWLGDDEELQETVFPSIENIFRHLYAQQWKGREGNNTYSSLPDRRHIASLPRLFEQSYWRRVWIIQELAFGGEITLICGSKTLPMQYLETTINAVYTPA